MSQLKQIVDRLEDVISLENTTSLDQLGSYIVGALVIDDNGNVFTETNPTLTRIADLGSDLETSNGTPEQLSLMWDEIKSLVQKLV